MDTFMSLQCQSTKTRRQRCIFIRADPVAFTLLSKQCFRWRKQNDIRGLNLDIKSKSIMNSDCRTLKRHFLCVFHSCLRELALTCSLQAGIFVCSVCLSDFKLNLNFPSWALHRHSRGHKQSAASGGPTSTRKSSHRVRPFNLRYGVKK